MRLTIERLRTLVLAAGALLVVALVVFLVRAHWKSRFLLREIPKRLGVDIQQESNEVLIERNIGEHSQFKIRASKVVQMKQGTAVLHDVQIELFGEDGKRVDRITGGEFEYDQKNGKVIAAGPVEITLEHPGEAVVGAPKSGPGRGASPGNSPLQSAAATASHGEIHVKTSALTFDQKSGMATTAARVEFAVTQGKGSSMGATLDSDNGRLVLDRAVELSVKRGDENVLLHAQHAEFERDSMLCRMHAASASVRGGEASAGDANVLFRDDGSAMRLDASNGFSMKTATAAHVAAPRGWMEFDEHNQPRRGRLEGGATLDSSGNGRQMSGSAPSADLVFASQGSLQHAHLERGVTMHSEETTSVREDTRTVSRDWRSLVADLDFRPPQGAGDRQVELSALHGTGGVVITGSSRTGQGPAIPSRMAADEVTASFGAGQVMTGALGTGRAVLDQITSSGTRQTTSGDRIEVNFTPSSGKQTSPGKASEAAKSHPGPAGESGGAGNTSGALAQIESATVDGNVVLVEEPKRGPDSPDSEVRPPLRATAGHAVYEGREERLHLTESPRVNNGALQLTADTVDVMQASGDAFAHGSVKATWAPSPAGSGGTGKKQPGSAAVPGSGALGGEGPAHIVADEAHLHQSTGEATFRGQVRLWEQANSIAAPEIILNRTRQTLVAHSPNAASPVRVVMLGAGGMDTIRAAGPRSSAPTTENAEGSGRGVIGPRGPASGNGGAPSVIRVRGGELKYSEAERKAVMNGGAAGSVIAETGTATSTSKELELVLLPPGNHAGKDGGAAQVDRMTASGDVVVSSQGRRGTGQRLVYSSETGEYVLTGTAGVPPRMTDPARGNVSGASLIFNSRDDSVSIEGAGGKTLTETTAPK